MTLLRSLQIIAIFGTILTGIVSLFWPRAVQGFTGLTASSGRGITEIRSVLGGTFIGLGVATLALRTTEVYLMLGVIYLAIGLVRAVSMVVDKSMERSNLISLAVEILFGGILVLK